MLSVFCRLFAASYLIEKLAFQIEGEDGFHGEVDNCGVN